MKKANNSTEPPIVGTSYIRRVNWFSANVNQRFKLFIPILDTVMLLELQPEFDEILQPLGNHGIEFFLAASLYHAKKISFASAAHIAGLNFESFKSRLEEHFDSGYIIADESALADIQTIKNMV